MESKEMNMTKESKERGGKNGFIDRSKLRILLFDSDSKSYEDIFSLLLQCSYQVMSAKDKVFTVAKCLRFGAVDYTVKPLQTNELLNFWWTHMWKRWCELGMAEKNTLNYDDLVASNPSDVELR